MSANQMGAGESHATAATGLGWALNRPSSAVLHGDAELRVGADGRPGLRPAAGAWQPMATQARVRRTGRGRATRVRASGAVPAARPQPDPATARLLAESTPTPAGRFFLPLPLDEHWLPAAPDQVFVVHVVLGPAGFRIAGRPVPPRTLAKVIQHCPEWWHRPVLVLTSGGRADQAAAGSLLVALAAALDVPVLSSDAEVYLATRMLVTTSTFLRWNSPERRSAGAPAAVRLGPLLPVLWAPARSLALPTRRLSVTPPAESPQSALILTPTLAPTPVAAPIPAPVPARILAPVKGVSLGLLSPVTPIRMPSNQARGQLPAPASFVAAEPGRVPRLQSGPGPVLTAEPIPIAGPVLTAEPILTAEPPAPPPPRPTARPETATSSASRPEASGVAAAVVATVQPAVGASWIRVTPKAARADREALRALLGWEYEAHARVVDGVLALLPGLRTMAGSEDMLAGLVAIRAQLSPVGPTVDDVLRGETAATAEGDGPSQPVLDPTGAELLARCAASGLRRLPAVVGPVFRPGAPGAAVLANYRFGTRLVEPSFAEATLNPGAPPGTTVQYVIWSFTGRRMDRLTAGSSGGPRVLFSTGSHFVVLAVDEPTEDGVPLRVLLREVAESARADAEADDRARQRLRETMRTAMANETPSGGRLPAQWRHPIGVRDDASPFELAVGVQ